MLRSLMLSILVVFSLAGASAAGVDPASENVDQRSLPPGPDFTFETSGPCKGVWRDTLTGSCVHADAASSGELELDDDVDLYDPTYVAESLGESGPRYCNNSSDYKTRVLYVLTQAQVTAGEDRYDTLREILRTKSERVDYWVWKSAKQTGGSRHVRYVCNDKNAILIDRLVLPNDADSSWSATKSAMRAAGYDNTSRKYLPFIEWRERDPDTGKRTDSICGRGEIMPDDSAGQSNANNSGNMIGGVYLRAAYCNAWAKTAMHELGHVLGGVQQSAPNHNDGSAYHVADDWDRLGQGETMIVCPDPTQDKRYDCRNNDYFNTSPLPTSYLATYWNVARNRFLVGGG